MGYSKVPMAIETLSFDGLGMLTTLGQQQQAGARFTSLAQRYRQLQNWAANVAALPASQQSTPAGIDLRNDLAQLKGALDPLMARMLAAARRAKSAGWVDDQGYPTPAGTLQLGVLHTGRTGPNTRPASSLTVPIIVSAVVGDDLSAYVYGIQANPDDLAAIDEAMPSIDALISSIDWQVRSAPLPGWGQGAQGGGQTGGQAGGGSGGSTTTPPGGKPPRTSGKPPGSTGSGGGSGSGGGGSAPFGLGWFNIKLPPAVWWTLAAVGAAALVGGTKRRRSE